MWRESGRGRKREKRLRQRAESLRSHSCEDPSGLRGEESQQPVMTREWTTGDSWGQLGLETSGWHTYRCGGYTASLAESLTEWSGLHLPEHLICRAHGERRPCCQRQLSSTVMSAGIGCHHVRPEGPQWCIDSFRSLNSTLTLILGTYWEGRDDTP